MNSHYVETTPEKFFAAATAIADAGLIDGRRGICSGMTGDVAWIAVRPGDGSAALAAAGLFTDPDTAVSWSPDRVADVIAEVIIAESAAAGD